MKKDVTMAAAETALAQWAMNLEGRIMALEARCARLEDEKRELADALIQALRAEPGGAPYTPSKTGKRGLRSSLWIGGPVANRKPGAKARR